jgi:hypothetical protein
MLTKIVGQHFGPRNLGVQNLVDNPLQRTRESAPCLRGLLLLGSGDDRCLPLSVQSLLGALIATGGVLASLGGSQIGTTVTFQATPRLIGAFTRLAPSWFAPSWFTWALTASGAFTLPSPLTGEQSVDLLRRIVVVFAVKQTTRRKLELTPEITSKVSDDGIDHVVMCHIEPGQISISKATEEVEGWVQNLVSQQTPELWV